MQNGMRCKFAPAGDYLLYIYPIRVTLPTSVVSSVVADMKKYLIIKGAGSNFILAAV